MFEFNINKSINEKKTFVKLILQTFYGVNNLQYTQKKTDFRIGLKSRNEKSIMDYSANDVKLITNDVT